MNFCAGEHQSFLYIDAISFNGHAQAWLSTQNNKYVVSLEYLKKELGCEVDVLHAEKQESLLQVDAIIFDGVGQACPKYSGKFAMSLWHLLKQLGMKIALAGPNTTLTIILYIQCSPTIESFPLSIWNPYQAFFFFINCLYNISSFLLFQVSAKVVPRKLACLDNSYLPQKRRKNCPKWAKDRIFLEFIENFGHWFFLNLFTLFALLLHESYIWEKYIYFLRYGLKCSQPIKLQDF